MKTKILFVCLGNICRSPIAEGIFLHLLKSQPDHIKDCFEVDSAGTSNYHTGELPDVRMRQTAESHNIHLTSRARTINASDLDYYDLVIAMDLSNLRDIQALKTPPYKAKVVLMRSFEVGHEKNVPDPYFGGSEGFEAVYQLLLRCNENLLNDIITHSL